MAPCVNMMVTPPARYLNKCPSATQATYLKMFVVICMIVTLPMITIVLLKATIMILMTMLRTAVMVLMIVMMLTVAIWQTSLPNQKI